MKTLSIMLLAACVGCGDPPLAEVESLAQTLADDLTNVVTAKDYQTDFAEFEASLARCRQAGVPADELRPWMLYRAQMRRQGEELARGHRLAAEHPEATAELRRTPRIV